MLSHGFFFATVVIFFFPTYHFFPPLYYRLAWDFSVGQLSSKVLKSSQLVGCRVFRDVEDCARMWSYNILSAVGYMLS